MSILMGLGNPGKKYQKTRHNVGFMVSDEIIKRKPDLAGRIVKPQTFMNKSGEAVIQYKDRVADLVVIHDDIDLPLGTIRVRLGGSSGGHKGVHSIIETIGEDFWRMRVGVGRPPAGLETEDYVLKPFEKNEIGKLTQVIDAAAQLVLKSLESNKFEEKTIIVQ